PVHGVQRRRSLRPFENVPRDALELGVAWLLIETREAEGVIRPEHCGAQAHPLVHPHALIAQPLAERLARGRRLQQRERERQEQRRFRTIMAPLPLHRHINVHGDAEERLRRASEQFEVVASLPRRQVDVTSLPALHARLSWTSFRRWEETLRAVRLRG